MLKFLFLLSFIKEESLWLIILFFIFTFEFEYVKVFEFSLDDFCGINFLEKFLLEEFKLIFNWDLFLTGFNFRFNFIFLFFIFLVIIFFNIINLYK